MKTILTLLLACTLAAACASAGVPNPGSAGSHDRDVVTAAELAGTHSANLEDALRQLRPEFFTARGISSIHQHTPDLPTVYLDDTKLGGLDALHNIDIGLVVEVRRLTPREATIRLGTDNPGGVLLVTTTHRP